MRNLEIWSKQDIYYRIHDRNSIGIIIDESLKKEVVEIKRYNYVNKTCFRRKHN